MRRSKRGDDRQKSETNYNSKHTWTRNDPSWTGDQIPQTNLNVYDPFLQYSQRAALYPAHDHFSSTNSPPFYKSNQLSAEKKNDFSNFLQMFTTFMLEAKNKEDDLTILRNILEPILYNERPSQQIENLAHRLKLVEDSLLSCSLPIERIRPVDKKGGDDGDLRDRIESLEEQVRIMSSAGGDQLLQRIHNLEDEISGESSIGDRVENLEILIHGSLIQRLENIENKCNNLSAPPSSLSVEEGKSQQNNSDSVNIVKRISEIESHVVENGRIPKRIELLERRITALESVPNNSTFSSDVAETSSITRSESDQQNGQKRRISKETIANDTEPKPVSVVQDSMSFIVENDNYVSVFIDGVGSSSTEDSPGIRVWFGNQHPLNVSRPITNDTTNNVAHLMAVQIAVDISTQAGLKNVIIHTSSKFLIHSIAKLNIWHARKWTKKNGHSLKHVDKLKRLRRSLLSLDVVMKETKSVNEARLLAEVCAKIKKEKE